MTAYDGYSLNRARSKDGVRTVAVLPKGLLIAVDEWGVAAGCTSRRQALIELLEKGLRDAKRPQN